MKRIFSVYISLHLVFLTNAQTKFLDNVKVEYEKVVYIKPLLKDFMGAEDADRWGADAPQSTSFFYDFIGNAEKSVYKPGAESGRPESRWDDLFGTKNTVITDYQKRTFSSYMPVFGETFIVEDSLLHIKWKLTADTRTIAGLECRKALGMLNDSIAIFAFYTDEIMVNGGPERIHGLPGLILGAGIPRLHTTWFATKVQINNTSIAIPAAPKKAKRVTYKSIISELDRVLKSFGPQAAKLVSGFMI